MNFDRLKEVTKETIQRENAEDGKIQDILNIFKRFEPDIKTDSFQSLFFS